MWVYVIAWLIAEVIYYSYISLFYVKSIDRVRNPERFVMSLAQAEEHMRRMCETIRSVSSIEEFTKGFFCGASMQSLGRDNVLSFCAWAFTGQDIFDLRKGGKLELVALVERCMSILEEYFPSEMANIKPGYNKKVKHVSMCLDKVNFLHRPFIFFAAMNTFNAFYDYVCMQKLGGWSRSHVSIPSHEVNRRRAGREHKLPYWYRGPLKHSKTACVRPPLVFLHGISYGWIIYTDFLNTLEDRAVYMLDVDSIRIGSLSRAHPSPRAVARSVKEILKRHGHSQADIVGHSFGTMIATSLVNYTPEIIGNSLVLIDPVCLLLSLPDVAYNFLYKPPESVMDWMLVLGASRELTVARTLYRDFIWFEGDMVLERIPDHVNVYAVLAEKDNILNAPKIQKYVEQYAHKREIEGQAAVSGSSGNDVKKVRAGNICAVFMRDQVHGSILFSASHALRVSELVNERGNGGHA